MVLSPQLSLISSILGFIAVMAWRIRESRTAVTARKIVIPPIGMASGFCMFIVPGFRMPVLWGVIAFLVGALILAYPLLRTSRLTLDGSTVMMERSRAFFIIIVILAIIRIAARGYLDQKISIEQSAALFFVLAFGMILRWRLAMYREYRRLTST